MTRKKPKTVTANKILRRAAEILRPGFDAFGGSYSCVAVNRAAIELGVRGLDIEAVVEAYAGALIEGRRELRIGDFEGTLCRGIDPRWYTHRVLALLSVVESGILKNVTFEVRA